MMLAIYTAGVAIAALVYGYLSPEDDDGVRAVVTCIGWPVIVVIGVGAAVRMMRGAE